MTTVAAARLYLAQHLVEWEGKGYAVHNPDDRSLAELPVIYGFNNCDDPQWCSGILMAEDGTALGGHLSSHESYMPHDLGILEGSRPDRHETFRAHYPDGYRMEFVRAADVRDHKGLMDALGPNQVRGERHESP